ncbi:hypothetical protein PAXRUDRAFT_21904 [Paxillus rubicundulus Ve08.2h10]|uniref:Uncharacterized protein n=1 Tax=Paxillus rubicundulus Ve08.2h10 TaxID=930991 RepID=A0A0D0CNZ1_9AGAM|nr:hypothetical protein PAXRUDRAFT_21904 [Paxillus rubicundulus Ve08.2h10]
MLVRLNLVLQPSLLSLWMSLLGCDTTLTRAPLTPQELFNVDNIFERGHITEGARTKTPPPTDSPPPDAEDSPMVVSFMCTAVSGFL